MSIDLKDHPRLEGLLLSANDFVSGGVDLVDDSTWHSCVFLLIGCLLILAFSISRVEKRTWSRIRGELLAEIETCKLDKCELITALEDSRDDAYEEVLPKLKRDEGGS